MTAALMRYAGVVLLVTILALIAVLGSRGGTLGSTGVWPPEFSVNRIAVVGPDAQIRSYRPDGSGAHPISDGEGFFTWPTWSPDGRRIVFSGVVPGPAGGPTITLFSSDGAGSEPRIVHQGVPGFAGLLADRVVHYPLWSPDSGKLAFVAVTREHGLALYMDDTHTDSGPEFVLDRGPLWMSWSSDSSWLLVHRAGDHFLVKKNGGLLIERVHVDSTAYRVPAWRPDRHEVTLALPRNGSGHGLYLGTVTAAGLDVPPAVSDVGLGAAFHWSRSGDHLAVADDVTPIRYSGNAMYVYRQLRVLESRGFSEAARVTDNLLAFFWSPDGSKVAYATLANRRGTLRWTLLDVPSGTTSELVEFLPSSDQLTMFQFFDQYAYSHLLWSPDSRYLIFSGQLADEASAAGGSAQRSRQSSEIYIIDTENSESIDSIAEGTLAFWSPV